MRSRALAGIVVAMSLLLAGCFSRIPMAMPSNATGVSLFPRDIVIKGPTQGRSSAGMFLNLHLGLPSFHEAERKALAANNSDVLLDRYRYIGKSGFVIGNFVVIGSENYYVEGTGVQIVK